ncbi:MAG: LysM peptidoglycan-binding domain-containing protein [Pararhodobacter sp.]|nr:LysM peptidoglycan-binding domain-containing protein [Pararhodobacter sp.]
MAVFLKLGFLGWGAIAAAGAVAGALAIGTVYQAVRAPEEPPAEPAPEADIGVSEPAPAPDSLALPAEPEPEPEEVAEAEPAISPPTFDVVRIARDGAALVAGTAAPGAGVTLRVDGDETAQGAADRSGQFVAMFSLGPSDAVQMMTLEMVLADGRVIQAEDSVVLTPRPAPVEEEPELPPVALGPTPEAPIAEIAASAPSAPPVLAAPSAGTIDAAPRIAALPAPESATAPETEPGAAETMPPEVAPSLSEAPRPEPAPGAVEALPDVAAQIPPAAEETPAIAALPDPAPAPAPAPEALPVAAELPPSAIGEAPRVATLPEAAPPAEPEIAAASDSPELPEQPQEPAALASAAPQAPAAPEAEELPEEAMPRAFLLRSTGEVALLDRAPQVMDNVVIDMIGYGAAGDVQISGRAARTDPEGRVQLYLDNRPIALARAEAGDWRLDLPDIDPGIYTLRVDQLGDEGQVISRFETPFQREAPEVVARARAELGAPAPLEAQTVLDAAPASVPEDATDAGDMAAMPEPAPEVPPEPSRPEVALITVQPGHSLWRISSEHYGEGLHWVQIYRANRGQIRNPDLIYPGQIFTLPD